MDRFIIAGIDRTSHVLLEGIQIEQVLTQAVDTCSFRLKGFQPNEGDEIIVESDAVGRMFGGIIDRVQFDKLVNGVPIYSINCQDYTYQFDRRLVVETYENVAVDVIARDILAKYCSGFTGNNIQTGGPTVEYLPFEYKRPSECFKELAEYVGWDWFVDYFKDVWLFDPSALNKPAPTAITPDVKFRNLKHTIDQQGLRNRVYVRGGTMLSDPWTYSIKADGAARQWILPHKPHQISMTVNGTAVRVGIENVHDEAQFDYMMNYEEKYVRASNQTATIASGTTISWTYKYDIDVITMVEDIASQKAIAAVQGGDGVYEHVIADDSLTTIEAAEAAGYADLRQYANPKVKGSFETEMPGWSPGQLVTIDLPEEGVKGTFLVQKVTITSLTDTMCRYKIDYGGRLLGIADFLKALVSAQQKKKLNDTALLHKFAYGAETAKVTDEVVTISRSVGWKVEQGYESLLDVTMPGDPSFSRSSVAYTSTGVQVSANVPRFEPGKFGQAIMVEEGTTNALSYAFASDTNLLQCFTDIHSGSSVTIDTTQTPPVSGQKVVKHYAAVNDSFIEAKDANGVSYTAASTAKLAITGGAHVTCTIWAKGQNGGEQIEIFIFDYASDTGSFRVRKAQSFIITNTWQRYVVTIQTASDAVRAWMRVDNNLAGQTVYWCAPQLESKAYATSFISSTRFPETLTIPTAGVLNPQEGTVECWVYITPTLGVARKNSVVFIAHKLGTQIISLFHRNSKGENTWAIYTKDASGSTSVVDVPNSLATGWRACALKWTGYRISLLLDGAEVAYINNPKLPTEFEELVIGVWYDKSTSFWNSFIDDLRISSRARTDEEIAAAYQSGLPLAVDADTTYKLPFDGNLTPQKQAISPTLQAVGSNLNVMQLDSQPWAQLQYATSSDGQTWGAWQDVYPSQAKLASVIYPGYYKIKSNRSVSVGVKNWKKPFDESDVITGFVEVSV